MEKTKLTANLPKLDVEVLHVQDPEQHAEALTIKMTANPSFEAVGNYLAQNVINPATLMWAMPFRLWSGMMEAAWRPWLMALMPRLNEAGRGGPFKIER
jgi:hypothetical protein